MKITSLRCPALALAVLATVAACSDGSTSGSGGTAGTGGTTTQQWSTVDHLCYECACTCAGAPVYPTASYVKCTLLQGTACEPPADAGVTDGGAFVLAECTEVGQHLCE